MTRPRSEVSRRSLRSRCCVLVPAMVCSAAVLGGQSSPPARPQAPPRGSVAIASVRIAPERPAPGTLCQLLVTLVNRGTAPASRFRFAVTLNGRSAPPYAAAMYVDVVAPGASRELRLYNFWSGEQGAGTQVQVTLAAADWVQEEKAADDVPAWSSIGGVPKLPNTATLAVRSDAAGPATEAPRPAPGGDVQASRDAEAGGRWFQDVTAQSGIRFVHERPTFDARLAHIMKWVASIHAGSCAADYDRDGDLDFYVLTSKEGSPNALYRNDGHGRFADVAPWSGVADLNDPEGLSMVCLFADADNDGHQDLLVGSYGRTRLLKGSASGRFSDIGIRAGLTETGNVSSAVFLDYDRDGWLDLLVGRYFPHDMRSLTTYDALPATFHSARNGGRNLLYRNNRDGTFTEVGASLGVDDTGWTLAVAAGDLDNDGDADVYVANDFGPDVLYKNNGDGSFTNATDRAIGPDEDAGMNAEFGDFDGDGLLDIYVTNITNVVLKQGNMLWRNLGELAFENVATETHVRDGGWGWAAKFIDYDNDGDLDIYTVNGFVSDGPMDIFRRPGLVTRGFVADLRAWPDMRGLSLSGYEKDLLFRNDGGRFTDVAASAGVDSIADGRGISPGDVDLDGDADMLVTNVGASPILYRNDVGHAQAWLAAELSGVSSNRDAIGARVTVAAGGRRQIREVDGGSGYNGQGSRVVHVGVGASGVADSVEIRWPGGRRVRHLAVPARVRMIVPEE